MTIFERQRRFRELGRIRIGEKNEKGYPTRLDVFRLTSPSLELLRHASGLWGGIPNEWEGAPGEGTQYELTTESDQLEVYVPPQNIVASQLMELYTRGGIQRRCDGSVELRSGRACMCDPDNRECSPTTHVLFFLPQLPDIGSWRLTSRGWNVAVEMPATVELLSKLSGDGVIPMGTLAIEVRTSVVDGQTKHYNVPVLRVPYALADLQRGGVPVLEAGRVRGKPPLTGERPELPADPSFAGVPDFGDRAALPDVGEDGGHTVDLGANGHSEDAPPSPAHQSGGEATGTAGVPAPAVADPPDTDLPIGSSEGVHPNGEATTDGVEVGGDNPTGEGNKRRQTSTPPSSDQRTDEERKQDEALTILLKMCNGSLARAAAYTNKACGTKYVKTSIGNATLEELDMGIAEAERVMAG